MANCLAGLNPLPCLAYKVAPTLYSGTSGVAFPSVTFATAGVYRFCSFVREPLHKSAARVILE